MIMAGVIIVAMVLVVTLVVRDRGSSAIRESDDLPTAPISGWDDSSPIPTDSPSASPPSAPGSSSPDPSAAPTGRPEACDRHRPDELPEPPNNGRVHGGPLSFAALPGDWSTPRATSRFPYSKDTYAQTQTLPEDLGWEASAYVGISAVPEKLDGETATERLLQCIVTSDFYTSVDVAVTENAATEITVGDASATRRDALLRFEHPHLETTGSRLRIIVVESSPRTFYFHAVPMERDDLIAELDTATKSLRLG